jgi:hypothetical protein
MRHGRKREAVARGCSGEETARNKNHGDALERVWTSKGESFYSVVDRRLDRTDDKRVPKRLI